MKITDLPLEVLVEILTYVPLKERQATLSWKIKSFYEASTHPRFKNDFCLNLRGAFLDENCDPVQVFEDTERVFSEVVFYETTFGSGYENFVRTICEFTETVHIRYKFRKIETKDCAVILGCCHNVKSLTLEFNQGFGVILNASEDIKSQFKKGLKSVEKLVIAGPIEARIESFVEFLEGMPRLKVLDLRKLEVFRSEEKQFYDCILPYIASHSKSLKGILFQEDYKPENLKKYERLIEIQDLVLNQFEGTALRCWKWSEAEYNYFRKFLQKNCHLTDLRLKNAQQLEWGPLMDIIKEHPHLKRLEVDSFSFFLSVEAGLLYLLPEIETIVFRDSMDHQHNVWPLVNQDNLIPATNSTLKELIISKFYSIYTPSWLNCDYKVLNRLEIRDCEIEDEHVHLICEKLSLLEDLTITSALITDFAITGRPRRKSQTPTEKIKTAIVDLKHLKSLALDYDDKITSNAFADFNLNGMNLESLSLEGCERINHSAITHIVKNCPNLIQLNVNFCNKLKDESIEVICQNLLKLRRLKINELPAVTGEVFKILSTAKNLRYLHMKDYVRVKDKEESARALFKQLESLRIVKLGLRQEIHRFD
uniref:CSON007764 protein n=1 Tax=Culicoides sonorensis TaxID=179676 RepID=A0A336KF47_CULSO